MGKRKVATVRTSRIGRQSVTRTYVHDDSPGKMTRFAAFTGISPYNPRRAAITAWVAVFIALAEAAPWLPWVFVLVTAAAWGVRRLRRPSVPTGASRSVPVGPAWCDHCADWTVHATAGHTV